MALHSLQDDAIAHTDTWRERGFVAAILVITALTYSSTVRFDFTFDDYPQIVFNPLVKAWKYVPGYFTSSVWKHMSAVAQGNYYRPLFLFVLRVNYFLFANHPMGWHFVSLLLHLVVTWQVYVVVKRFSGQFTLAWLTAAIFGLHPVHHEVIGWVSACTESLFAALFLAAFWAYLKSREGARAYWLGASCGFYLLALLSKETAIVLPALVFAADWIDSEPPKETERSLQVGRFRRALLVACSYLPVAVLYWIARNHALSGFPREATTVSFGDWLLTLPSVVFLYIRNFFVPFGLSEFYDLYQQHAFNLAHVALPACALLAAGILIWSLRRRLGAKSVSYATAWFFVPMIPALNFFVFSSDQLAHDRYLYVPSIGLSFLLAVLIERAVEPHAVLFGQPSHAVVAGAVLALLLAFGSVRAVSYWSNDYALYTRAHQIAPRNATATNNLGAELMDRNELDRALTLLQDAYQTNPRDFHAALSLGRLYYGKGDLQKAEFFFDRARAQNPAIPDSYIFLGRIRLKQSRVSEAQAFMSKAVDLDPYSAPYHASYGIALAIGGSCEDANRQFDLARALSPGDAITAIQFLHCRSDASPAATSLSTPD